MLKALLRVRLLALFYWFTGGSRSRTKPGTGKLILYALLMTYVMGCFAALAFGMFSSLASVLAPAGLGAAYFALLFLISFGLMFLGSVFTAKSSLYEAKDTELLLSLPLTPGMILGSRLFLLVVVNLLCGALMAVPGVFCWQRCAALSGTGRAAVVLLFLALSLFATAVSALFGWLLSRISARVKRKSLVTSLLSLSFLLAYFLFVGRMQSVITAFIDRSAAIADDISAVQPLMWLGLAVTTGDALALAKGLALLLLPFVLACFALSRSYIRTVTDRRGAARTEYREKKTTPRSPARALLGRELTRFGLCSSYLVNTGLGAVFLLAGGIALLVMSERIMGYLSVPELTELRRHLPAIAALAGCAVGGLSPITAPSVSLEGRTLWLLRSLPVCAREILRAKLRLHLVIMCPAALAYSVCCLIALRPSLLAAAALLLLPQLYILLTGILGLWENLRHPSLDWTTETQAVKSGIGLLFTMLMGFAMLAAMAAAVYFGGTLPGLTDAVLPLLCLPVALGAYLLWRMVLRRGAVLWSRLN